MPSPLSLHPIMLQRYPICGESYKHFASSLWPPALGQDGSPTCAKAFLLRRRCM